MEQTLTDYSPLIRRVAVLYRPAAVDIDDAISAATLALYDCLKREAYKGKNGAEFQTYITAAMKYAVWNLYNSDRDMEVPLEESHSPTYTDKKLTDGWKKELLISKLSVLNEQEREVICRSFGIDRTEQTVREIGRDMNVSHVRIVHIRQKALLKLKHELASIKGGE